MWMEIDILNSSVKPSFGDITNYVEGNARKRWKELIAFIENNFKSAPTIAYSKCSAKPGWNVKYKKCGRALCTLYPDKDIFTALVVLSSLDMEWLKGMRDNYTSYTLNLYDNCRLFNGTKWLMIDVTSDEILDDIEKLLQLKLSSK